MSEKKYLTIQPSNVPATGKISHKGGNPIITITLGRQAAMLDLDTIRLSGDLDIWSDAAGSIHPTDAVAAELRASHKLGAFGIIDQLVFRHAETKQVIEHIRHYGRFMSSFLPVMSGLQDQTGHLSESALINSNYRVFRDTVVRNNKASPFSIPLPSGMTLGADKLPLSKVPIEIEIHLAPDSQFFYSSSGATGLPNVTNSFYELTNVELTCEVDVGDQSPDQGAWTFNSISSYFSTLESTNSIINYNLGLSKVLGAFVNFVPSSFVNNLSQDGYLTYMPSQSSGKLANLETISFLRNGERFPLNFEVDSVYDSSTNATSVVDAQVIKSFLHSIIPESQHNRTGAGPLVSNRSFTVDADVVTGYRLMPECGGLYGVGVLYDMLDSEGVDFSRAQFSIQMTNGLADGNPVSAYLFVKSKVVVAYDSRAGIQVVQ